jgi:hypothetical protein
MFSVDPGEEMTRAAESVMGLDPLREALAGATA